MWGAGIGFGWRRVVSLRLERQSTCRTQHASTRELFECRTEDKDLSRLERNPKATRRILCRQSQGVQHPVASCGYRLPATGMECPAQYPIWSYHELQPDSCRHRPSRCCKSCGRSNRGQRHQHPLSLPSRHRQQPFFDRLCRRPGGKENSVGD